MRVRLFGSYIILAAIAVGVLTLFAAVDAFAKDTAKPKAKAKAKPKEEIAAPSPEGTRPPWALRDHFTFTIDKNQILYAVEDVEWTLRIEGLGDVVENVGFLITFADGSTVDGRSLGKGVSDREKFDTPIGKGTAYVSEFPGKDGLVVRYSMMVFSDRPYIFIKIGLGNTGDKPIEIAKITPVALGPNGLSHLSPDTEVAARHLVFRGGSPTFDKNAPPVLTIFRDRAHQLSLSIGVLPQGIAASSAELLPGGGGWLGDVVCTYAPPITIAPGQKFESDPVWLTVNVPVPARIDQYYTWAMGTIPLPFRGEVDFIASRDLPRCWATIEKGASETDLLDAAKAWSAAGVKHVLLPSTWEGRPGSLEGGVPAFPKDIAKTAKKLEAAGVVPGLTLDPLVTSGGNKDWTAASADGTSWLNLSHPDARAQAVQRMRKMADSGFGFFVLPPSSIPDEVLKHFNMTRVQVDNLAFGVMREAAGKRPVFPAASYAVKADVDSWLEAAVGLGRMTEMGITPGPVRLEGVGASSDDTLLHAMAMFGGPIEFVGAPKPNEEQRVAQWLQKRRVFVRPVDAASASPKIWQVPVEGAEDGHRGDGIVMFPGAAAWTTADLALDTQGEVLVWRASDGEFVDLSAGPVPAATNFTIYGITPKQPRPVLMGASVGMALLLDDLKSLTWNESTGVLSGAFMGGNRDKATAYVYVPEGWTLKSGKAGRAAIKKDAGKRLQFPVEPGVATAFNLEFAKN